jgi:hypothetical protein
MKGLKHVYMDAAGDGEGGATGAGATGEEGTGDAGAGAGNPGGGDAGAGGAGASGADAATGEGQGTALQKGAPPATIPEKYQVKKEDGTLDIEASSLKLAEAYGHLEKRLGSGDVPPKTAEEYQVTVPDALKDVWKPDDDTLLQDFKKEAHSKGMTGSSISSCPNTWTWRPSWWPVSAIVIR